MGGFLSNYEHLVFFDLETSEGTSPRTEILQIAAKSGNRTFNEYIRPQRPIPYHTTQIHGLYVNGNTMYNRYHEPVRAVTQHQAMRNFINFLKGFNNRIILVGHDCHRISGPILLRAIGDSYEFHRLVTGFSDTLPIVREKLSDRDWEGKNYTLSGLIEDYLNYELDYHDAMEDTRLLESLVKHRSINISYDEFTAKMKTTDMLLRATPVYS